MKRFIKLLDLYLKVISGITLIYYFFLMFFIQFPFYCRWSFYSSSQLKPDFSACTSPAPIWSPCPTSTPSPTWSSTSSTSIWRTSTSPTSPSSTTTAPTYVNSFYLNMYTTPMLETFSQNFSLSRVQISMIILNLRCLNCFLSFLFSQYLNLQNNWPYFNPFTHIDHFSSSQNYERKSPIKLLSVERVNTPIQKYPNTSIMVLVNNAIYGPLLAFWTAK